VNEAAMVITRLLCMTAMATRSTTRSTTLGTSFCPSLLATSARCGHGNQKSGGLTLQCAKCGIKNARDMGIGASNILFRTMAAAPAAIDLFACA
jgi:hypothetical protein